MTGQIASHQPPHETGGAEHDHVQLTVRAHRLILESLARTFSWPSEAYLRAEQE
jgi:hypothetical protein